MQHIISYTLAKLSSESTGHDFYHAQRVAKMARYIFIQEGYSDQTDCQMIEIAAYLHDILDPKITKSYDEDLREIKELLKQTMVEENIQEILQMIDRISYTNYLQNPKCQLSYKEQILQDADRLDALGAIGIARAFAFGGHKGNLLYDPKTPINKEISLEKYINKKESTVHHFYDKLLKLESLMNTKTGQKISHQRTKYMQDYLKQFFAEWNDF